MKGYASFIVFFYIYFLSRIQKEANGMIELLYIKHD